MAPRAGGVAKQTGINLFNAIIGAAFQPSVLGLNLDVFQFTKFGPTGTVQIKLSVSLNGRLFIRPASGPLAIADGTQLIQPGIYNYIEWQTGFSHGSVNVIKVNGQTVYSGVLDGQATTDPGADTYFLLGQGGGSISLFDDFYIVNPDDGTGLITFAGDSAVICGIPSSDDHHDFTPNPVVAHYLNVKEIPCDFNSSYNQSAGSGTIDSYFCTPNLTHAGDIVFGAQYTQLTADVDGGTARPVLFVSGSIFQDPALDYGPSTYFPPHQGIFEKNPLTHNAWTATEINATSWGVKQT